MKKLFYKILSLSFVILSFNSFAQSNWTASNIGISANSYVNDFAQTTNGDIYIIVNVNAQGQLLKSTTNGSSWTSVTTAGLPTGAWAGSLFAKNNTLFLGSLGLGSFLYSSTDNGQNWTASNSGLPANAYVNDFAQTTNGDIYIIVNSNSQGQLLKSTTNGSSWTPVTTAGLPTGAWAGSLFAKNNTLFLGSLGLGSFLYSSTDNGQNWSASNSGLPANAYVNDFAQTTNGDIYIIVNSNTQGQLLKSTTNGSSWTNVATTGLPTGAWAGSLSAKSNTLFLGSLGLGSLLYTSTIGTTGINEVDLSNSVVLFPNPSRGQINISCSDKIDLIQITNVVGQVVYEQQFNNNQVSFPFDNAGIYFVTVTTRGQTITKKITVAQ